MRILVFGASITQGFWDTQGGWASRLRNHYDKLLIKSGKSTGQPTIFNLGVSGDSSADIVKRFKNEVKARLWPGEESAFIFSVGTNNAREENGEVFSQPEEYRKDLEDLISQAKEFSDKIMFVGLPSCDESRTTPVSWRNIHYTNAGIFKVEEVMRDVCAQNGITHVPVFEEFQERFEAGNDLFYDGLHPNDAGHEIMFRLIRPELDKLLNPS